MARPDSAFTDEELAARKQVSQLREQLVEYLRRSRREATIKESDGIRFPACPYCGSSDLQYDEEGRLSHDVASTREGDLNGDCCVEGNYTVTSDEWPDELTNPCLYCRDCHEESRWPERLGLEWV